MAITLQITISRIASRIIKPSLPSPAIHLIEELILREQQPRIQIIKAPSMALCLIFTHPHSVILEADLVAEQREVDRMLDLIHALQIADVGLSVDAAWPAVVQGRVRVFIHN